MRAIEQEITPEAIIEGRIQKQGSIDRSAQPVLGRLSFWNLLALLGFPLVLLAIGQDPLWVVPALALAYLLSYSGSEIFERWRWRRRRVRFERDLSDLCSSVRTEQEGRGKRALELLGAWERGEMIDGDAFSWGNRSSPV